MALSIRARRLLSSRADRAKLAEDKAGEDVLAGAVWVLALGRAWQTMCRIFVTGRRISKYRCTKYTISRYRYLKDMIFGSEIYFGAV